MSTTDLVARVRDRVAGGAPVTAALRAEPGVVLDDGALAALSRDLAAELDGAGPLEPLLVLPGVTDVLVNSPREVWIDRGAGLERSDVTFADDAAVRRLAQRLATAAGRRLDDACPCVDVSLPDGTRLHAVLPPVAPTTTLSLRVLARRRFTLAELVPSPVRELLAALVAARLSFVISGGTGTGKTTLLSAVLGEVPGDERLVTIEDARELAVRHPHVVSLAARTANVEGAGEITLRDLVRQALRMRPDRIVVGEFRGAETVELLLALNTGHDGSAATVHANSAADVPARLVSLGALGALTRAAMHEMVSSCLDVVVHLHRGRRGRRSVAVVGVLVAGADGPRVEAAWRGAGAVRPGADLLAARIAARGVEPPSVLTVIGSP